MFGRFCTYLALVFMTAGLLSSCAGHKRESALPADVTGDAAPTLLSIDQKAEQIVGLVPTGDWPRIYANIEDINNVWVDFTSAVVEPGPQSEPMSPTAATLQGRVSAALSALKDAAARRDAPATTRTANDLSEAAVNYYEYYHAAIPPDLHTLGVLERQILIDLSSDAYDSAFRTLNKAEEAWHRVQATITARAGQQAAQAIDGELEVQRASLETRDRTTLISSVQTALSLIDDVQRLY